MAPLDYLVVEVVEEVGTLLNQLVDLVVVDVVIMVMVVLPLLLEMEV